MKFGGKIWFILLFCFVMKSSFAQIVNIYSECGTGEKGGQACVTFRSGEINGLEGMQFSFSFNPQLLSPINGSSPAIVTNSKLVGIEVANLTCNTTTGVCIFTWIDGPINLNAGDELFTVCFDIIGNPGQCAGISFGGTGLQGGNEVYVADPFNPSIFNTVVPLTIDCCVPIITNTLTIITSYCEPTGPTAEDGKITFYVTGGAPSYNYTIFLPAGGGSIPGSLANNVEYTVTGLKSGVYSINVVDQNGSTVNKNIILTDNLPIEFDIAGIDPSCYRFSNGQISISNIQGGLAPYKIKWSNNVFETQTIEELASGTYWVEVEDQFGCKVTKYDTIHVDTLKLTGFVIDSALCYGVKDGTVSFVGSGGVPFSNGYTFFVKKPEQPFLSNAGILPNYNSNTVQSGIIQAYITDNGSPRCYTDTVKLFVPYEKTVQFNATVNDIKCKGDGFGSFLVEPYNSGTTYASTLYDSNTKNVVDAAQNNFSIKSDSLVSGSYYVVSKSTTEGCIDTFRFTITEPLTELVLDTNVVYPSCNVTSGSIQVIPSGGVGNYTYKWSDNGPATSIRSNLNAGVYTVSVTDEKLCEKTLTIEITEGGGQLNLNINILNAITCNDGNDGALIVNTTEPGTITYRWENLNNPGIQIGNASSINNLVPGIYQVTVSANGCTATARDTLFNPDRLVFDNVVVTKPECENGGFTGSIGIATSGGFLPHEYEWYGTSNPNVVLGVFSVLPSIMAGNYGVRIIDAVGCIKDTMIVLPKGTEISVNVSNITPVTCFNDKDGKAIAQASSTNPATNMFNYIWSSTPADGGVGISSGADALGAGENWVIATDLKCGSDTIFFNTPNANEIKSNAIVEDAGCDGACTGFITLNISGGDGAPYSSKWTGTVSPTNLCPGQYIVTITDKKGCEEVDTFNISQGIPFTATIDEKLSSPITCRTPKATIAIKVEGNIQDYDYKWSPNVSTTYFASELNPGIYTVTVDDGSGCKVIIRDTISAVSPVKATVANPINPNCYGDKTCIRIGAVSGGVPGLYTFQINQGINVPIDSCVQVFAGTYLINVFDQVGCKYDTIITVGQPEPVVVDLGPDLLISLGDSIDRITPEITSSFFVTNYLWSQLSPMFCIDTLCTEISGKPLDDITIRLAVVDENGCVGNDEINITVEKKREVIIPNIIQQNSGDENGFFNIKTGPSVRIINSLKIFDRWGNIVYNKDNFQSNTLDPSEGWDGKNNGVNLMPGVYVYFIQVSFIDGRVLNYTGDITLIR